MKLKSRKSGISLISLIITIIVIIILAAVVIFSGMDTPEKAQLSKVISDIDNVQTAVDQAYYGLYTEKAVAGEVWTQSQFYEAVAKGITNRDELSGDTGIIEIQERSLLAINLPEYEGRKWGLALEDLGETVKTGSVLLIPGFVSNGKTYSSLLDVQNGGSSGDATSNMGGNQSESNSNTYTDLSGDTVLKIVAQSDMQRESWKDISKVKEVLQAEGETMQVPIPIGYDYYLGTGDTGLVITDANKNEFVWIPIENAKGTLYEESETPIALFGVEDIVTTKYESSGWGDSRPDLIRNDFNTTQKYHEKAGFDSVEDLAQDLVKEFNNMVESVEKYGGFYVGRYELGKNNTKLVCKSGVEGLNSTWYELYKDCKEFSSISVGAGMMSLSQWNAMINFIGDHTITKTNVSKLTGQYGDEYNHIHDTSTSLREFVTTSALYNYKRIICGGSYRIECSAGGWEDADSTVKSFGTRVQLYIK